MENKRLTKNFRLKEFFVSDEHIDHAKDLFEACTQYQEDMLYSLASDIQGGRDYIASTVKRPEIRVNSGYRDKLLNDMVGGKSTSLHTRMLASDIKFVDDKVNARWLPYLYDFFVHQKRFGEVYLYKNEYGLTLFIHYARPCADHKGKHGIYYIMNDGKRLTEEEYHGKHRT